MCNRPWRRLSELLALRRLCNGDSATGCAACSFSFAFLWQSLLSALWWETNHRHDVFKCCVVGVVFALSTDDERKGVFD